MRHITDVYKKYYVSDENNIYIFQMVSPTHYSGFYYVREEIYLSEIKLLTYGGNVNRIFFTKSNIKKIINYHKINGLRKIDMKMVLNYDKYRKF